MQSSLVQIYRRFGEIYYLHLNNIALIYNYIFSVVTTSS
jgi:hypothetical protein